MNKLSDGSSTHYSLTMELSNGARKNRPTNIYIWDMDETLILLKSLLDGTYVQAFGGSKDSRKAIEIGKLWETQILQVCDDHFFYEQIEEYNEPYLLALSEFDDGKDLSDYDFDNDGLSFPYDDCNRRKLAYRHRAIAEKYSKGLHNLIDQNMIKQWDDLYMLTDSYTDGWLSSGRDLLDQTSGRNKAAALEPSSSENSPDSIDMKCRDINVLVTSGSLIPSLVKCMLFRLDGLIPYENVYSSWEVGKLQCFLWIRERFAGPSARFCVIGDGMEECEAAERMCWPFVKMDFRPQAPHRLPGLTVAIIEHYMELLKAQLNMHSDLLENGSKSHSNCSQKLQQEHSLSSQESNNAGPPVPICTTPLAGNPYFASIVLIPRSFHKSLPNANLQAKLVHRGKTWEMKYYGEGGLRRFGCGWKKFAIENNLKVGDGCVFELVDDDKELKLGVQIINGQIPAGLIKLGSAEKPINID